MSLAAMRLIGFILGIFLITLAVSMAIPMITLVAYERSDDLSAFLWSSLITFICGLLLIMRGRPDTGQLRPRDMYLLTTGSWVVVCTFAALPMVFISDISCTDAFFETMSGITTTGSTVLSGLDTASPGLLIWRSMLHWLGGIGFIGMAASFPDRVLRLVGESDTSFARGSQVHSLSLSGAHGRWSSGALDRWDDTV
jgi:trk system potassium uptake protein TrkH